MSSSRAERWVPGVRVIRRYQRAWLQADLLAGAVLAAILVPQGMAYADLLETLDREHFYPTLEAALEEIRSGDCALDRLGRS